MAGWQKLLIVASLICLAAALYLGDYLTIPTIVSPGALAASVTLLFLAFIAWCLSWRALLNASSFHTSVSVAIASTGLAVFAKYIPGKLWTIVGRAAHVAQANRYPLGILSALSLKAQLIDLWTGLLFGGIGLYAVGGLQAWGLVPWLAWGALTVILFTRSPRHLVTGLVKRILRKDLDLEKLGSPRNMGWTIFWSSATWVFLAAGFHLLVLALFDGPIHWSVGLAFPLAGTLGIMAFIVPGGLGVREGLLAGFLTMTGLSLPDAVSISIASRLWYLAGEVFIFLCGALAVWLASRGGRHNESYASGE